MLDPPFSEIEAGLSSSVTLGSESSSPIVTVTPPDGATVSPDVVPVTRTVSSGSSVWSSTVSSENIAVPLFCWAGMVSVKPFTGAKSVAAAVPGATVMAISVSTVRAAPSSSAITVTVREAPSWTSEGDTERVTVVDGNSLSVMVSVRSGGSSTPRSFSVVADTVTRLLGASTSLSTASIVTDPVLSVAPMGIVSVVPICRKSPATAGATGVAVTVIVVAAVDGLSSVAVTVVDPPSSRIDSGVSTRVAFGSGSTGGTGAVSSS